MDSNYKPYDHIASFARLDSILAQSQSSYEEVDALPDRDRLTYANGFYAYCSALFVDIRDSSKLPSKYQRPALAKLYRAYISEMVAILNGTRLAREVNIVGDGVWAVLNTPARSNIDEVFAVAARVNTLVEVLNYKLRKAGYTDPIRVGIGMAYGRALMIKAGYNGSGLADVVYMGDVVNAAAKLAAQGSKGLFPSPPIMIDDTFAGNLDKDNVRLVKKDWSLGCYVANVIDPKMHDWYEEHCT
ncbi:MAG: adenylate/guanylate cyclase domain-containing protein [Kineosporiaceae bacterium]|nr:adenylate/guanylate cyclase domain-containing protein [Kineosporiaceae bacterium]